MDDYEAKFYFSQHFVSVTMPVVTCFHFWSALKVFRQLD